MKKITVNELTELVLKAIRYKNMKKCIFSIHNSRTEIDMIIPHMGIFKEEFICVPKDILTFSFFFFDKKTIQKGYEIIEDEKK